MGITSSGLSGPFESKQLTSVTFPNTLTYLGGIQTFHDNLLTSITIPNSVTLFTGADVFADNLIASVTLPNTITSMPSRAFINNKLTSVTLPGTITNIPIYAFASNQLTSITIPSSVTSINDWAFANNKLTSVVIPSSVTLVNYMSFAFNQLTSVTIEGTPTSNTYNAFANNDADFSTALGLSSSGNPSTSPQSEYLKGVASIVPVYMPNGTGGVMSNVGYNGGNTYQPSISNGAKPFVSSWGGQLINPAQLTVQYKDTNGNTIAPAATSVGDGLGDYKISTLYDLYGTYPALTNPDALTHYYLTGTSVSKTAPTINGYTLTSSATQSIALNTGSNTLTFVYKSNSNDSGSTTDDDDETPAAPNTGLRTSIVSNPVVTVSGLVLIGAIAIVLRRRFVR